MLRPGRVCREASDKIVSTGEKIGYWLVKIGLDGDMGTTGRPSGVRCGITGLDESGGGTYLSTSRHIDTMVKADKVPTLTCPNIARGTLHLATSCEPSLLITQKISALFEIGADSVRR